MGASGTNSPTRSTTAPWTTTSGATIHYTTNGNDPTTSDAVYSSAISVSATQTIKALAVKSTWADSAVASAAYVITGTVATPTFSVARIAWLEMGGVYAQPNLRGGGEYGEAWHKAGTKLTKQNVFDAFIAAAEHQTAEK